MESAANFHHQFQDQLVLDSPPSCYGAATNHSWNPNAFLSSSHNFIPTDNNLVPAALGNNPMNQELVGFQLATTNNHGGTNPGAGNFSTAHDRFQLGARDNIIKDELSEPYPANFTEMINSPPSSSIEDLHLHPLNLIKNDHHHERYNSQLNSIGGMSCDKVLLTTFSNHRCDIKGLVNHQFPPGEIVYANYNCTSADLSQSSCSGMTTSTRWGFSQIFPTVNISGPNTNNQPASVPSSLDLFNSARFSGGFIRPSFDINGTNLGGVFKDTCLSYGLDEMQQLSHTPADNPSKITGLSSYINGGSQGKRSSEKMDTKGSQTTSVTPIKKSRVESRSSCPPFKVRKEKLGDRIAALQQLVAPFGKTDTASVLMEAIGYIKFLQNQVEKLSVPYIKTSRAGRVGSIDGGHKEARRDLRSRGLCLVPLSCLSYVTDGGGGIWPTP